MRLICSNCDAQYDVDDSVIPDAGRDVQCSNCGHAWFQPGPYRTEDGDPAEEAFAADAAPEGDGPGDEGQATLAEGSAEADDLPEPSVFAAAPPPAEPASALSAATPNRTLDEEMLNVLREEAALETRARRDEGVADLDIQPDLGLAQADTAARPPPAAADTDDVVADTSAVDAAGPAADTRGRHRRGLLPDIEEINSTLTAAQGRAALTEDGAAAELTVQRRGGFRLGFSLSLIMAGFLLALYVLAPPLARQVPALAPALTAYVSTVNQARLGIDGVMRRFTDAMRGGDAGG